MMKKYALSFISILLLSACTTNDRSKEETTSENTGSTVATISSLESITQEESSSESTETISEVAIESVTVDAVESDTDIVIEDTEQEEYEEEYEKEGPIINGEYEEYEHYEEDTEEELEEKERVFQLASDYLSNHGFFLGGSHDFLYSKPITSGLSQSLFFSVQSNDEDGFLSSQVYPLFEEASLYFTDIEIWLHDLNREVILIAENGIITYSIIN